MKKNQALNLSLTLIVLTLALTASPVWAIDIGSKLTGVGKAAGFSETVSLATIVGNIIKAFLSILGMVFMAYIIYAGQLWMTARGSEEQITKAKAIIRGSIIGIIIIFAAYAITSFVVNNARTTTGFNPTTTQTTPTK